MAESLLRHLTAFEESQHCMSLGSEDLSTFRSELVNAGYVITRSTATHDEQGAVTGSLVHHQHSDGTSIDLFVGTDGNSEAGYWPNLQDAGAVRYDIPYDFSPWRADKN
jgi:hypothetical protein